MSTVVGAVWQALSTTWASRQLPLMEAQADNDNIISINARWHLLGPFQIGTREWQWSSDPLYAPAYGGFHSIERSEGAAFPSSLAPNGSLSWTDLVSEVSSHGETAEAALTVGFDNVDWDPLRSIYGWAATQYQAWARGHIYLHGSDVRSYEIYTNHIVEFWLDDEHCFGGDFYGFERAPLTISLPPGRHRIDVRLVRDVRAMGGLGKPTIDASVRMKAVEPGSMIVMKPGLIADVVNGSLVSPFASVIVRNPTTRTLEIISVHGAGVEAFLILSPIRVYPGQIRPIAFNLRLLQTRSTEPRLLIAFSHEDTYSIQHSSVSLTLHHKHDHEFQRVTYLHQSGIVSYSMLRPPTAANTHDKALPILVGLHGAGVEADSELMYHSLDGAGDLAAWTLFPSGVTSWSGDDWHEWGWADVEAAIAAITYWIECTGWKHPAAETNQLLMVGHSNGGQGVWYATMHHPDRIIAAAEVSGYSSIQQYVPYTFWHEADPRITAVLQNALKPYQHELLLPKAQGIPLLIQHGSSDDNVPVFHARRMSQLASQAQVDVEYHELAGMGHWFEGVMTTKPLLTFYDKHLRRVPGASYDTHTAASQRGQPNSTEMPGNMNGLFLTTGAFQIRYCHDEAANIALQISRNFYQYLAADSDIFATCGAVQDTPGNVITVGIGKDVSRGDDDYPITLVEDRLVVRDPTGTRTYTAGKHGLAAIFLRPLSDERVEMVVWGADLESLRVAARLVPLVTGAAQPHFVVTTRASLYKGASAALAMGFFNPDWAVADGA